MQLEELITDIANALIEIDASGVAYSSFQPGVGPYGEPQLLKLIKQRLNFIAKYEGKVETRRTPDLLIPTKWAIEFKIARPFGDNGNEAENWSVNLLHPYQGNTSTIGDCFKLINLICQERKAVTVIGYEHNPPKIDLTSLIESFEAVAKYVCNLKLSKRIEIKRSGLVHPVHQSFRIFSWEVLSEKVSPFGKGGSRGIF